MSTQRYAAGIEYLGTHFKGFQAQKNPPLRTVEATISSALSIIANENIQIFGAGRTDTGVHAHEQVIHFDTRAQRSNFSWLRGVNHHLPDDCVLKWIKPVSQDFHARFSAKSRFYYYHIWQSNTPSALFSHTKTWLPYPLDLSNMQKAAQLLVGEHNFNAFRSSECQAKSPVRHLYLLDIIQQGNEFIITAHANGFLHHMVRNITGVLIDIGRGRHDYLWAQEILLGKDRKKSSATAKPEGLFFAGAEYDKKWGIHFNLNPLNFRHN